MTDDRQAMSDACAGQRLSRLLAALRRQSRLPRPLRQLMIRLEVLAPSSDGTPMTEVLALGDGHLSATIYLPAGPQLEARLLRELRSLGIWTGQLGSTRRAMSGAHAERYDLSSPAVGTRTRRRRRR